jgi:hypothetical protein
MIWSVCRAAPAATAMDSTGIMLPAGEVRRGVIGRDSFRFKQDDGIRMALASASHGTAVHPSASFFRYSSHCMLSGFRFRVCSFCEK